MRIVVTNDDGITCDAELNDGERRVTGMRLDDDQADRTLVGLSALSGCIAAVLEDVAQKKMTLRQAADRYMEQPMMSVTNTPAWPPAADGRTPPLRILRPLAPTCEGGCE